MRFSILYRGEPHIRRSCAADDLRIKEIACAICGSGRRTDYFVDVVSRVPDAGDIEYRRGVLRDLRSDPELFDRLETAFSRYDRMRGDWNDMRGGSSPRKPDPADVGASLERAWSSLRAASAFPAALRSLVSGIYDALSASDIRSEALCEIRDHCGGLLSGGLLARLTGIAEKFRTSSLEGRGFEISVEADGSLGRAHAELVDVFDLNEKKKPRIALRKNRGSGEPDGELAEELDLLLAQSLYELDAAFTSAADGIYNGLYGLSTELTFYRCAADYCGFLEERGVATEPEIADQPGVFCADGLRDLLLMTRQNDVTPNNVRMDGGTRGMLIRGENGAGKTTFLRSVGCAVTFFRAGLPIPADRAAISASGGVYTHFSSSEDDNSDLEGRFEGEVRKLSDVMSEIEPSSLLLLNETFQTTVFSEGAEAMRGILSALDGIGVKYIFVTHIAELFANADPGVKLLEFDINTHDYTISEETK